MRDSTKRTGTVGEEIAALELERRGWRVIERNFRCAAGEMDLIAEHGTKGETVLVFVEVKTRHSGKQGTPLEAVTPRKQTKLIAVANAYLGQRGSGGEEPACRFDVVEVFMSDDYAKVVVHSAVFGAD